MTQYMVSEFITSCSWLLIASLPDTDTAFGFLKSFPITAD